MEIGDYGAGSGPRRALAPLTFKENMAGPPRTESQSSGELERVKET